MGPPAASSGPGSSGMSRAYVSSSGQLTAGFFSPGTGAAGLSSVTQPLDLISEDIDPSSSQYLGCLFIYSLFI